MLAVSGSNVFHLVADGGEELLEGLLRDDDCAATIIGVETERRGVFQTAVQKEDDMMVRVVDKAERTDAAGLQTQIAHHAFRRSEREFARGILALRDQHLLQPVFNIMDS